MPETWVQSLGWDDPLKKGNGCLLQCSCLKNSMERGTWWAVVHGVPERHGGATNTAATAAATLILSLSHSHLILSFKSKACQSEF